MKNILFVYPPFCTPASPPYSITYLASFLKNNTKKTISTLDLNIFYHNKKYPEFKKKFNNLNNYNNKAEKFHSLTRKDYNTNNKNVLEEKMPDLLEDSLKMILKHKPDLVAFSLVYNSQVFYTKALIDELKKRDIKVIIGGPAINNKLNTLQLDNEIDLLNHIEKKEKINFNTIPDFTSYKINDYFSGEIIYPLRTAYSCYYGKCAFCTHHENKKYKIIPLNLIEKTIIRNNCKNIFIIDDMIPKKRLLDIAKITKRHNVKWTCQLRPSKELDKKTLKILYECGLKMIIWGVESGSDRILKLMKKGITKDEAENILKQSHEAGIKNVIYMMFGFPSETKDEFLESIDLLERNKKSIDLVSASTFGLQKDSPIYKKPEKYFIKKIIEKKRTLLNPKITYLTTKGLNHKEIIRLKTKNQKKINNINKYPKMMNYFREHMLLSIND